MRFRVLGPLEVESDRRLLVPGGRLQRALLALLIFRSGRPIGADQLMDELWDGHPPSSAAANLRTHMSGLRRLLDQAEPAGGDRIQLLAGGYLLQVESDDIDAAVFEQLAGEGRRAADQGQLPTAVERLTRAVGLWRGPVLGAQMPPEPIRIEAARLEQARLDVVEDLTDARLAVGHQVALLPELQAFTARYPLRERSWRQLMIALYRAGRRGDALAAYQQVRGVLATELGVDPGADLQQLHQQILATNPALDLPRSNSTAADHGASGDEPFAASLVPNQLPSAVRHFTGRNEELSWILQPHNDRPGTTVIAVDGMGGIGKTTLAVMAAHHLAAANRYPDGVLFVDLHGYSNHDPTDPADALDLLLRGLGVQGPQIPPEKAGRVGLYRTLTAQRRLLIVLDNARDEAQVRPLIPGARTCTVMVTSRRRMAGLDDADHLTLEPLSRTEASRLFRAAAGSSGELGTTRVIDEVVHLCGLLPLTVRVAAARLKAGKELDSQELLDQLREAQKREWLSARYGAPRTGPDARNQNRLWLLDDGDRSIQATLDVSVQHLPPAHQAAFAVLSAHPGVDLEPYAAAALLDTTPSHAHSLLDELEQANLLDQPAPDRYRFHDLVRAYASSAQTTVDTRPALDRLYNHYSHAVSAAMGVAYPDDANDRHTTPTPTPDFTDEVAALAWLDAERPNLLATAHHAALHDRPDHLIQQSAALHRHLRTRGAYSDAAALHRAAVHSARTAGDRIAESHALNDLGRTYRVQGRQPEAAECHTAALAFARASGNTLAEVRALIGLGWIDRANGRHGPAADCYSQAVDLAHATGNHADEIDALNGLGHVHYFRGRYSQAFDCHTRAAELAHATANPVSELSALNNLGWLHHIQGQYEPAITCLTRAIELARATGSPTGELEALNSLGHVHREQHRYQLAADCLGRALELARRIHNQVGELSALTGVADIHRAQGNHALALARYTQVLEIAQTRNDPNWQFGAHLGLGHANLGRGHPDRARTAHQRALQLAYELDQPPDQVRALDGLAQAERALGNPDQARQHWLHALNILVKLDPPTADDVTADGIRAHLAGV